MQTTKFTRPDWVDPDLYPFDDKWILIGGHRIHYVDKGSQDKPVLLFVPPGAGWSFTYRYHIEHLSDDFRCVAPDLPGYGLSEAGEGYGYSLLEQAAVLERFVQALDLRNIIVWGNDGGGPTAIIGLARQSARLSGLVVGGTFGWSLKGYPSVARMIKLFTSPIPRVVNRYTNLVAWSMGTKMALGTRKLTKSERHQYTNPFKKIDSRDRTLKLYASFNDPETQEALDNALPSFRNLPVLIQFGDKDPVTKQGWAERWAAELPNHTLMILPSVRHFTFEGAPETTVENFRSWWTGTINKVMPSESLRSKSLERKSE